MRLAMAQAESSSTDGVDFRAAVTAATKALHSLVEDRMTPGPILDVSVEGFARDASGRWVITLGYRIPSPFELKGAAAVLNQMRPPHPEFFKDFTIDHRSGEVIAMSVREPRRD